MKLEDFNKYIEILVDAVLGWAKSVVAPLETSQRILLEAKNDADAITRAAKLFITAFGIGSILQGGIYRLNGIGLDNFGFYLSSATFLFMGFVISAYAIYRGFIAFKIPASLRDTIVFYTVSMSAFYPIVAVLSSFRLAQFLTTLKAIKATNPDLGSVSRLLIEIGRSSHAQDPVLGVVAALAEVVVTLVAFSQLAIVFCRLAQRWKVERAGVFDAGCFGEIVFGVLPMTVIGSLQVITLYAFL